MDFGQLFKGFDKFMPSLTATLVWAIPLQIFIIAAYIPLILAQPMMEAKKITPESFFTILIFCLGGLALMMIVWIFIHPFLMFVYQLITEHQISGWQALKLSFKSVWGNLGGVIGLLMLNVLAYFVGVLFCGIGAYFVLPLIFANTFVAYRKVFPKADLGFNSPPPPSAFNI